MFGFHRGLRSAAESITVENLDSILYCFPDKADPVWCTFGLCYLNFSVVVLTIIYIFKDRGEATAEEGMVWIAGTHRVLTRTRVVMVMMVNLIWTPATKKTPTRETTATKISPT